MFVFPHVKKKISIEKLATRALIPPGRQWKAALCEFQASLVTPEQPGLCYT